MSSKLHSQELLRHVHTSQLATANHRGTNQSHITGFSETICQCQALQTDENNLVTKCVLIFSIIQ